MTERSPAADLGLGRQAVRAVLDDRRFRRRPAHVEHDHVADVDVACKTLRPDDARGRARFDDVDRVAPRRRSRQQAAARLHDHERRAYAHALQARFERGHVALDHGADVCIDHRRAGALVLVDLRQQLRRGRHRNSRQSLRQESACRILVRGIDVGVDEAHRDRVHLLGRDARSDPRKFRSIERLDDLAASGGPLAHLEPQPPLDERIRLAETQVVQARRAEASDLQHVAESARGHERHAHAAPLDDRVGGDGRAVGELGDRAGVDFDLTQELADALLDRAAVVVRRGEHLAAEQHAIGGEEHDVGERAADVDAKGVARVGHAGWAHRCCDSWIRFRVDSSYIVRGAD